MNNPITASYNQTDRIQGMAAYMNADGASIEWLSLSLIAIGAVGVWFLLKWLASLQGRKATSKGEGHQREGQKVKGQRRGD